MDVQDKQDEHDAQDGWTARLGLTPSCPSCSSMLNSCCFGATVIFGNDNVEPLLGVTPLESVGIEVDPRSASV
jgi:hypothetical protein